ncbi:flagellar hook-length control protein FliK [Arthrobacter sp. ATA002]|uniref:flagellar hook-length control protein FliK n=1 Tax=Arthrobacter sp. ATA002 TaxID=2991715 RepID=UPI003FA4B4DF
MRPPPRLCLPRAPPCRRAPRAGGGCSKCRPRTPGGTARTAPVSAGAGTGYAGLEVQTTDGSVVQPPVGVPAPAGASFFPAAVPAAVPAPAVHSPQLLNQVSQPLVRLAAAAPGEHVMTLSVTPENLGPVTVRALISSEGVRVEMFAPTETAREALRHILADLRRDLAGGGAGMPATLTLSDQNHPGNGSGGSAAQAEDRSGRAASSHREEAAEAPGEPAGLLTHHSNAPGSPAAGPLPWTSWHEHTKEKHPCPLRQCHPPAAFMPPEHRVIRNRPWTVRSLCTFW